VHSRVRMRGWGRGLAIAAITALSGLSLVGLTTSAASAQTGPAKPYDFNGDGYTDLAIGSPYGKVGSVTSAGFVNVVYGSSAGLATGTRQVIHQSLGWVPGAGEAYDHFAESLASGDFDQDGFADLAVGVPDEDTTAGKNAGSVTLLWGSPSGLAAATAEEEFDAPAAGNRWGEAVAVGDIEGDGHAELFVTAPGMSAFKWLFFFSAGTPTAKAASPAAGRDGRPGKTVGRPAKEGRAKEGRAKEGRAEQGRATGGATTLSLQDVDYSLLTTGDVTGDGHDDVVYAWFDSDWSEPEERRGFVVYPGVVDPELDPQGDLGPPSGVLTHVGAVAVGDFDGDSFGDVAVGQTPDSIHVGGQVAVFPGAATNVTPDASYVISQETAAVPGDGEAGDAFGASLAAGDVNKDGTADLAVGSPTEEVNTQTNHGVAVVAYGSATGLTGTGSQQLSQDTAGVPGSGESGDLFGTQVSLLDDDNDGFADLIGGAPAENAGDGMTSWLKGTATGVTGTGSIGLTCTHFGVCGVRSEIGRRLGRIG
jgi:hypothetical protein